MDVAWGDALDQGSEGQDILGVRGLDQAVEARLVNGLTTVSQRGRYLTLLPWAVAEYFAGGSGQDQAVLDEAGLHRFLFRAELLALMASKLVEQGGDAYAALGARNHAELVAALLRGDAVHVPERAGAMLGTYFGPCQQLGLVRPGSDAAPYQVTPRGRAVWQARRDAADPGAVRALLLAETLSRSQIEPYVDHFALQRLSSSGEEAALLRQALEQPWPPEDPEPAVSAAYDRFAETVAWLRDEAASGDLSAERLLAGIWRSAARGAAPDSEVRRCWAEYEWRRRIHFAVELMLSAVATEVWSSGGATLEELADGWLQAPLPPAVTSAWPEAGGAARRRAAEAIDSVPADLWLDTAPPASLSQLTTHGRAYSAFALAAAATRQSAALRESGAIAARGGWGERFVARLEAIHEEPFAEVLRDLAGLAVRAHLDTTFRKMSRGMKCSLRLYADGPLLRPTGLPTGAGRSGPRLDNVVSVLRDAGVEGLETA